MGDNSKPEPDIGKEIVPITKKLSNAERMAVFKKLKELSKPEFLRIVFGISALIVNSITNLSFPW